MPWTQAQRKAQSRKLKARWKRNPNWRGKVANSGPTWAARVKAKWKNPEFRQRMMQARGEHWKQQQRKMQKKVWDDLGYRQKQARAHVGTTTGRRGKKNHFYVDGRSRKYNLFQRIRGGPYSTYRLNVYERDGYRCRHCGKPGNRNYGVTGIGLDAAHIVPYKVDPESAYDVDNGITLCRSCHIQFDRANGNNKATATLAATHRSRGADGRFL